MPLRPWHFCLFRFLVLLGRCRCDFMLVCGGFNLLSGVVICVCTMHMYKCVDELGVWVRRCVLTPNRWYYGACEVHINLNLNFRWYGVVCMCVWSCTCFCVPRASVCEWVFSVYVYQHWDKLWGDFDGYGRLCVLLKITWGLFSLTKSKFKKWVILHLWT